MDDEAKMREIVEAKCPDREIRRIVLSIMAEAINEVNKYGRGNWSTPLVHNSYPCLLVCHYYVLFIQNNGVWISLDDRFKVSPDAYSPSLSDLKTWGWTPGDMGPLGSFFVYKDRTRTNPFCLNGFYKIDPKNHQINWLHIRRLFFDFLYKAIFHGQVFTSSSIDCHSSGLLKYIRNELQTFVPDPLY